MMGNFNTPPRILSGLATDVECGAITREMLDSNYKQLMDSIREGFCEESWHSDILNDVDAIVVKGNPNLRDALHLLDETAQPQSTCTQLMFLGASQQDRTLRMHLLCFTYLILVEGVYDMVMRFLYAHHLGIQTTNAAIKDIVARFRQDGVGLSLSGGWNPTVRNAIGHATYFLDGQTETIRFEDRIAHTNANLTFDELRESVGKMLNVGIALSVLLIARVLIPMNLREASAVLGL
jgi:hypothetical protein